MKIIFTANTAKPYDGELFKKGDVRDLREDIAQRWVRRGMAEAYVPVAEKVTAAAPDKIEAAKPKTARDK